VHVLVGHPLPLRVLLDDGRHISNRAACKLIMGSSLRQVI
jgi:hypothetical protein